MIRIRHAIRVVATVSGPASLRRSSLAPVRERPELVAAAEKRGSRAHRSKAQSRGSSMPKRPFCWPSVDERVVGRISAQVDQPGARGARGPGRRVRASATGGCSKPRMPKSRQR